MPESNLHPVLEDAPDLIYTLSPDGTILSVNRAAEQLFGYSKDEVVGRSAFDLIYPADLEDVKSGFAEAMARKDSDVRLLEFRVVTKSGEVRHLEVNRRLILENGEVVRSEGIARDVTERKVLEDRLRMYKEIITNSSDAVVILDAEGRYLEQNPAHEKLMGFSDEDLAGKTPAIHAGDELFGKIFHSLIESGSFRDEVTSRTKDGTPIDVELLVFCVKDDSGELLCHVAFARDITERKREEVRRRARQQVREQVWKMRDANEIDNVLTAIRDGIETLGIPYQNCCINVVIAEAEPIACRCHRMTREGGWLAPETGAAAESLVALWRRGEPTYRPDLETDDPFGERAQKGTESIRSAVDVPFSHGTLAVTSTEPDVFSDEHVTILEELARVLSEGFQRSADLADLNQANTQLMQSEKMAALGNLMAGIAHEINTPVGAIHSMHDTLVRAVEKLTETMESEFGEAVKEHKGLQRALKIIEDSKRVIETGTERVTTIVRSLRNFARLDQSELIEVDIHQGIDDSLMLVHHDIKNRVEVVKNYGQLPRLNCYAGRLSQVFLNILNNAQQAIDGPGKIEIATRVEGEEIFVAIADSGSGIEEEHLQRLFEPTFTTKPAGAGTGLGLSITKQIVEEHGGRIVVDSVVGEGTTFTVVLPLNHCC